MLKYVLCEIVAAQQQRNRLTVKFCYNQNMAYYQPPELSSLYVYVITKLLCFDLLTWKLINNASQSIVKFIVDWCPV